MLAAIVIGVSVAVAAAFILGVGRLVVSGVVTSLREQLHEPIEAITRIENATNHVNGDEGKLIDQVRDIRKLTQSIDVKADLAAKLAEQAQEAASVAAQETYNNQMRINEIGERLSVFTTAVLAGNAVTVAVRENQK